VILIFNTDFISYNLFMPEFYIPNLFIIQFLVGFSVFYVLDLVIFGISLYLICLVFFLPFSGSSLYP
jgi:hypothetical protein